MKKCAIVVTTLAMGCSVCSAELSVGDTAPAFRATDQDGQPWALQDHLGGKYLVVYFYPAAMTRGCTLQACSYRNYLKITPNPDFTLVGISCDGVENLAHFKQAEGLNFTLLSDPNGEIATVFGVPIRLGEASTKQTVEGKEVELTRSATAARWTFILDPTGKVVYRNTEVPPGEDLNNVLEFLKTTKE